MRFLLVPVIALFALGLVGCAEETPGDAIGDDTSQSPRPTLPTGDPRTSEPTETSASGGSGTAHLEPCDLLTSAEQAQFNLGAGVEDELGPARACLWQASGQHSISVGVIDELGLDDVQSTGTKEPAKVGGHDAVKYGGPLGACSFAIGVTDTSRVDVSGIAGGDEAKACDIAKQAAELVEPKLP